MYIILSTIRIGCTNSHSNARSSDLLHPTPSMISLNHIKLPKPNTPHESAFEAANLLVNTNVFSKHPNWLKHSPNHRALGFPICLTILLSNSWRWSFVPRKKTVKGPPRTVQCIRNYINKHGAGYHGNSAEGLGPICSQHRFLHESQNCFTSVQIPPSLRH